MKGAFTFFLAAVVISVTDRPTQAADVHYYENGRKVTLTPDGRDARGAPAFLRGPLNPRIARARQRRTLTRRFAVQFHAQDDPRAMAKRWNARIVRRFGSGQREIFLLEVGSKTKALETATAAFEQGVVQAAQPMIRRQRALRVPFSDPLFANQWHLKNTGQSGGTAGEDVNIESVWTAGYLGVGVVIGIVDDGLEHAHSDLAPNYRPDLSYDFNDGDADPNPSPTDGHGTSVSGVAAAADNGIGVVGAAPEADLAGLRLVAAPNTDADEAAALSHKPQDILIYNNSWGPFDDALRLEGPGLLTSAVLVDGVATGRNGKGTLYVWAAGNGLASNDNANYDGYANSRFTIAVSASDHNGMQAPYSEPGACILVNAPSSDGAGITTTDLQGTPGFSAGDWTGSFGGTSSSSPLAAGCVALMLEANPNLTWRDVQHILVNTAEQNDPTDPDWTTNGAGRAVNHKYGFGRVDAAAAVQAALAWTNVAPETSAVQSEAVGLAIPDNDPAGLARILFVPDAINVESVEVFVDITHGNRGNLRIVIESPSGTQSVLAEPHADSASNFVWTLTTMRCWGELATGNWILRAIDLVSGATGTLNTWEVRVYGTLSTCGNGICDELCDACPTDCSPCCGDGVCDTDETCGGCPDCSPCCGDGVCNEPCATCLSDCAPCCGDGVCDGQESCSATCPEDCTGNPDCNGNGIRDGCEVLDPGVSVAQDVCADAQPICPGAHVGSTTTATLVNNLRASCSFGGDPSAPDVWYRYIPASSGTATVSTCGAADFDTQIVIHTAEACPGAELATCGTGTAPCCADDSTGCAAFTGEITFPVTAQTEYLIRITGYFGSTGNYTMTLTGPACLTTEDCDGNFVPDACDPDADGDGVIDACDDCPNNSGAATSPCCGDGQCDAIENCNGCPGDCGVCPLPAIPTLSEPGLTGMALLVLATGVLFIRRHRRSARAGGSR